ncbi:MAG: A24 family peptidase [Gammaproteobacteria bacterium]|nr:prepilin peptidase [Rhodocyclaceae bacterium]MBU3907713.1 A24 family peptidase [Gammaproteobacteria bacterium]MBU3988482.1 A24 family peptidase [Gammaproteobacteria bacterium]MBU4004359.1 A24 family peptidase [Gammaproteobacteria bacterium]MBU4019768.1 A24 family peptidase [Gammaproteobacteria bacterium]
MLLNDPTTLIVVCTLLGLMIGSFLNVVIHRLPIMMERDWRAQCAEFAADAVPVNAAGAADTVPPAPTSPQGAGHHEVVVPSNARDGATPHTIEPLSLVSPRSRCPHCSRPVRALENIPILSYLLLKGRCKGCGKAISLRYPLVEALTGLLFGYVAWRYGATFATASALFFVAAMIALTFIDLDTQLLPDDITLPLLWAGLLVNVGNTFTTLPNAVIGAAVGYLVLWLVYWLFKLATGKEGMGYGDFKLLAAIGAWLGWQLLPLVILLSSLVGAIVGIALIALARHGRNVPIPFGPYLVAAGLIALFWGKALNQTYLGVS